MSPREPYGNAPMTSAERVRRARWANRLEEIVFKLLELLDEAPTPLPRKPEIPLELIEKLQPFITDKLNSDQTIIRILRLGNGNQSRNKKVAVSVIAKYLNADIIDNGTVLTEDWGLCSVSAYTHPKGAMISTPNNKDQNYGGADWHSKDHKILFRDVGDGRCIIYISKIEPLFALRTIGHHGVTWQNIAKTATFNEILESKEIIKKLNGLEGNIVVYIKGLKAAYKSINASQRDQYSWIAKTQDHFVFTAEIDHTDKEGNKYNHKKGLFSKTVRPLAVKNGDAAMTVSHAKELYNAISETFTLKNKCRLMLVKGTKNGTTKGGIVAAPDLDLWIVREFTGSLTNGFSFVLEKEKSV